MSSSRSTKRSTKEAKELFADYVKKRKNRENLRKRKGWHKL